MLPLPLSDDARAAFDALRTGAVALARPDHLHLEFLGPKAGEVLTGLVTNDVLALAPGASKYAVTLTPKGKVIADMRIARVGDARYVTSSPLPTGTAWHDLVRKYVNPRLATYGVLPRTTISCFGPRAAEAVARVLAMIGGGQAPDSERSDDAATDAGGRTDVVAHASDVLVLPTAELGDVPGFDLLVAPDHAVAVLGALLADPTVTPGHEQALEVARVAAGRPRCGLDMDDTTIPQEANLGDFGALSFDKGCYTGQETVARLHFRGHVNKSLRRIRASAAVPRGAEVRTADGKVVGDVRSTVVSPTHGPIALAMIRREVAAGDTVSAHWEGAEPVMLMVES